MFLDHPGGMRIYSCASCDTPLTNRSELVSTVSERREGGRERERKSEGGREGERERERKLILSETGHVYGYMCHVEYTEL